MRALPVAKRLERPVALALALVAVDRHRVVAARHQLLHQLFAAVLGAPEDQRQPVGRGVEVVDQQIELVGLVAGPVHALG